VVVRFTTTRTVLSYRGRHSLDLVVVGFTTTRTVLSYRGRHSRDLVVVGFTTTLRRPLKERTVLVGVNLTTTRSRLGRPQKERDYIAHVDTYLY
jgi:hypothetical protein